uniref:Chloroplast envelope membrane protein n=1 Tax=Neogoniolithon spectabile TaxID=231755 RepID=A0A3G3MH18_9FLOR|nr:chloroplast envelope membrane protein [Neogoniolithon spectabile]AYR06092.1 chloroplast envelope membrane protein [Neogoniolithon spectabile]
MKNWNLNEIGKSPLDRVGLIPRSINKIFEKFKKELDPNAEIEALEEFKISKYHTVASMKYLLILLVTPIVVNQMTKSFILGPMVNHIWNIKEPEIFLNESQEERAFAELQRFEEKLHFEILIGKIPNTSYKVVNEQISDKAIELAKEYSNESVDAVKNIIADIISIITFLIIISTTKRQISILKSFINQVIYGLSDTAKAFLIILFTDIFVGFHSPHGWEVILETLLRHLGLPESRDFIFIFIATFPVVLDTIFKYWIFRYLNRISPSAVATYHSMNE